MCVCVQTTYFEHRLTDGTELDKLQALQRGLLQNGFRRLKPGGRLVYSTCSFATRQNEDIVSWLLDNEPCAELVYLPVPEPATQSPQLAGTLRFVPAKGGTSGLFIAKIHKRAAVLPPPEKHVDIV